MRYYIIAGEASGDLHASNLIEEIRLLDKNAEFRGFGGDKMKEQGVHLFKHYKETAYMGFIEVALHLRAILNNIELCKKDITAFQPDCVILVDYPGFNLRIAPFAKKAGFKVLYYISPQLWAWKSSRAEILKKYVDKLYVILPFEKEFYKKFNYEVEYVGHPLLDEISDKIKDPLFYKKNALTFDPIIAVLSGSRKQEIAVKLPIMLSMAKQFPKFQFVVACAPGIDKNFYTQFVREHNVHYLLNQTYDILQHSEAALVTSGTATLETALFNVPQIVCYKGSVISYAIAKQLIKVKYISLVNLIAGKAVVPELIQFKLNEKNLRIHFERLVYNDEYRSTMREEYQILKDKLGNAGASERTAKLIYQFLQSQVDINTLSLPKTGV